MQPITVEVITNVSREKAWEVFTTPKHIMQWNHPSEDWHSPHAENDLRIGGSFKYRMEAKDGSAGFDFGGTYDEVVPLERIVYTMPDEQKRKVTVTFADFGNSTHVTTVFDPENENPVERQRDGWQAILENFKKHVETV